MVICLRGRGLWWRREQGVAGHASRDIHCIGLNLILYRHQEQRDALYFQVHEYCRANDDFEFWQRQQQKFFRWHSILFGKFINKEL
jgi:hypothetical protein